MDLIVERRLRGRHREEHALVGNVGEGLRRWVEAAAARRGRPFSREDERGSGRRDAQCKLQSVHDARPAPNALRAGTLPPSFLSASFGSGPEVTART